jgi:hypothetical protein
VKEFFAACLIVCFIAFTAEADIIYFKDGLKTICQERAWEENDQVKCEYAGWVITYKKTDVLQIIKTTPPKKHSAETEKKTQTSQKTEAAPKAPDKIRPPKKDGVAFYDPRRPQKYWSDENSRYDNYHDAIQALAKKYNRSPEWIQAHMGDSNDLEEIHRNLADPNLDPQIPEVSPKAGEASGIVFYNPRRTYPYWTDASEKYKSYKEAIQALAQKYDRPPEWIQKYMGQTNDLAEIHRNLQTRKTAESPE